MSRRICFLSFNNYNGYLYKILDIIYQIVNQAFYKIKQHGGKMDAKSGGNDRNFWGGFAAQFLT
jgi:hypothetical protein